MLLKARSHTRPSKLTQCHACSSENAVDSWLVDLPDLWECSLVWREECTWRRSFQFMCYAWPPHASWCTCYVHVYGISYMCEVHVYIYYYIRPINYVRGCLWVQPPVCRCHCAIFVHMIMSFQLTKGSQRKPDPTRNRQSVWCVFFDPSGCVDIYPAQSLTAQVKKHGAETYFSHDGICQVSKPFHCHPQRSPCGLGWDTLSTSAFLPLCSSQPRAVCFVPGSLIFQEVCEISLTLQNPWHWSMACHRLALYCNEVYTPTHTHTHMPVGLHTQRILTGGYCGWWLHS